MTRLSTKEQFLEWISRNKDLAEPQQYSCCRECLDNCVNCIIIEDIYIERYQQDAEAWNRQAVDPLGFPGAARAA